jgi:DoxX-like family
LQVVQLDDVAQTVLFFLAPQAPARIALDVVGPDPLSLDEVIAAYRGWLGRAPARFVPVPAWLAHALFRLGDLAGLLGWRPPMRSTALAEIRRGVTGDPAPWTQLTGIVPRRLQAALAAEPASVQERWFARLYLLKPVLLAALALYWVLTGLITLGPGWGDAVALVEAAGMRPAGVLAAAGAAADLAVGAGIAVRPSARLALLAALVLSVAYVVLATLLQPALWADPLGPLVKLGPVVVLHLTALAILEDR